MVNIACLSSYLFTPCSYIRSSMNAYYNSKFRELTQFVLYFEFAVSVCIHSVEYSYIATSDKYVTGKHAIYVNHI